MHESLLPVAVIFLLLISGYYSGKIMRASLKLFFISKISNIVLLLLVCMGVDFGNLFTDKDIGYSVIQNSMAFSAILALITFFSLQKAREDCRKKQGDIFSQLV